MGRGLEKGDELKLTTAEIAEALKVALPEGLPEGWVVEADARNRYSRCAYVRWGRRSRFYPSRVSVSLGIFTFDGPERKQHPVGRHPQERTAKSVAEELAEKVREQVKAQAEKRAASDRAHKVHEERKANLRAYLDAWLTRNNVRASYMVERLEKPDDNTPWRDEPGKFSIRDFFGELRLHAEVAEGRDGKLTFRVSLDGDLTPDALAKALNDYAGGPWLKKSS